ncbi:sce7726 family protein [Halogeometricum borinquense]|uniref:Sce7726 family protein n=1 Tax=Halogeometricum borinquense TaxID=60847 RepID=A0A6C0UDT3_9EURY|nr:sce7726 family protein [Halogeometricum borinquense]
MTTKRDRLETISHSFLQRFVHHANIARSHRSYRTYEDYLSKLESRLTSEECRFLEEASSTTDPESAATEFLHNYRPNESILRSEFEAYLDSRDSTSPRQKEFPIGGNRCDLIEIDSQIVAYELKSPQDRRARLPDQLETYQAVFDKTWVVLPEGKSFGHIPEPVGEIRYRYPRFEFEIVLEATQTPATRPRAQLKALQVEELQSICKYYSLSKPSHKRDLVNVVESSLSTAEIDDAFNRALQNRSGNGSAQLTAFVDS